MEQDDEEETEQQTHLCTRMWMEHENDHDNVDEEGNHSDASQEHENHDATQVRETNQTGGTAFTIAAI
eukprot:499464-Rhodomonas_salina.1